MSNRETLEEVAVDMWEFIKFTDAKENPMAALFRIGELNSRLEAVLRRQGYVVQQPSGKLSRSGV